MCDGVSLIDVTHDEAGQAFKRAMDLESVSNCIRKYSSSFIDIIINYFIIYIVIN